MNNQEPGLIMVGCHVLDVQGNGFAIGSMPGGVELKGCHASNTGGHGFAIDSNDAGPIKLLDCDAVYTGGDGFHIASKSSDQLSDPTPADNIDGNLENSSRATRFKDFLLSSAASIVGSVTGGLVS